MIVRVTAPTGLRIGFMQEMAPVPGMDSRRTVTHTPGEPLEISLRAETILEWAAQLKKAEAKRTRKA